ncbi:helix-turn-helix domain-containing protein [Sulfurimonas sp. HSL1-6]|uniref:helix-turn-helix domain-containing protein n=1 Tax=Thiomicrolovo immobilis TaxID=3131935 RepID=UPI0031F77B3F
MSVKLMEKAWNADVKKSDKLVLLALADNASDEGYCWPSWETIMRKTGVSQATLSGVLKRLEDMGLVRREHRKRKSGSNASNGYWVLQDPENHTSETEPCHTSETEVPTLQKLKYQTSETEVPYEPSCNRHDEPSPETPSASSSSFANDGLFNAVYSELRLSGAQKYLGSKQNVYAAYLTVKEFIGIRDLAVAYKRYTMGVVSGENIVGLATFIENEMYLSFLPREMVLVLDEGREISGIRNGDVFQAESGEQFQFSDARFVEKLRAGEIRFDNGGGR